MGSGLIQEVDIEALVGRSWSETCDEQGRCLEGAHLLGCRDQLPVIGFTNDLGWLGRVKALFQKDDDRVARILMETARICQNIVKAKSQPGFSRVDDDVAEPLLTHEVRTVLEIVG